MGIIACAAAFFCTYEAARKSLGKGLVALAVFGYAYGIFRAHFTDVLSYFLFDASVLGMYVAVLPRILNQKPQPGGRMIRHWVLLLGVIPLILFFVPLQDQLIQLVGFRGNAWFLPFLIIGSALQDEDLRQIGVGLSVLNLAVLAVAAAEFIWGVQTFIPYTAATELIYRSNDVGPTDALRIPGTFVTAHVYGGQMMMSLPLIVGTWTTSRPKSRRSLLLLGGMFAAVLGVFLSATRLNFIFVLIMAAATCLLVKLRQTQKFALIAMLLVVGYLVSDHQRMQRFTTLEDTRMVRSRVEQSVNASILDAILAYPFGNGLGAGGTSIPAVLISRANIPLIIESEYARIQLELGFPGLVLWLWFLIWFLTRRKPRRHEPWFIGRTLGWIACAMSCVIGFIGIGMLTAIPSSAFLLLQFGWLTQTSLLYEHRELRLRAQAYSRPRHRVYGNVPLPNRKAAAAQQLPSPASRVVVPR